MHCYQQHIHYAALITGSACARFINESIAVNSISMVSIFNFYLLPYKPLLLKYKSMSLLLCHL